MGTRGSGEIKSLPVYALINKVEMLLDDYIIKIKLTFYRFNIFYTNL